MLQDYKYEGRFEQNTTCAKALVDKIKQMKSFISQWTDPVKSGTLSLKIIAISIFFSVNVFSQWSYLGNSGLSGFDADFPFIAVDNNGVPYVVYRDLYLTGQATVKKFDGSNWVTVGSRSFSAGDTYNTTMAFDNNNIPYVHYMDWANGCKATVMKFDGSDWVSVGIAGFSSCGASFNSIQIDNNNTPYVAFRDCSTKASVMKFNGSSWDYVGMPGFSASGAGYTSLAIDNNGTPYVAFWDMSDIQNQPPYKAAVMKFDGTNWVNVGLPGFAAWGAYDQAIAFDSKNVPYIACSSGGKSAVMKFDGTNWIAVGSQAGTNDEFIAIDKNDTPYVAYDDVANGRKATVMKFDGINWVNVGMPDFSPTDIINTTLAIDGSGNLYVAFKDGNTPNYYVSAMKFENTSSGINETKNNSSLTVYPNPTAGVFQINYSAAEKGSLQLNIIDAKGKTVYSETIVRFNGEYKKEIDLGRKAKGVYFVEMILENPSSQGYEGRVEKRTKKIILE